MIKVLVIIPYADALEEFRNYIDLLPAQGIQIDTIHIYGTPTEQLIKQSTYDIIVARGLTHQALKKMLPDVNHIEIGITGFDVIAALAKAKREETVAPHTAALIAHKSSLLHMKELEELSGITLLAYSVNNEKEISDAIYDSQKKGATIFIGGLTVDIQCRKLSLRSIHIKSGGAAIETALLTAVNTARSLQQERAKIKTYQSILNNTQGAIIAVDIFGQITAINNRAHHDLKIPLSQNPIGLPIKDYYKHYEEIEDAAFDITEFEALRTIEDKSFLVNYKPIISEGQCIAVLVTLQTPEKIAESETKIRKEISARGLHSKYTFDNILGKSEAIRNCVEIAKKYSRVNSNVLLTGETGTGKEVFAQSIHSASQRKSGPFVAINCAALPESLLESELFGYTEGTFSGGIKGGKAGLFELAHKGTVFLDEIGELPINLQAKLLRVLQEKEIRRLGDTKNIPVDVRVISATNIDVREKIKENQFRADLFYRLNLLSLTLPPLRGRIEDIVEQVTHFISMFAYEYGKPTPILTPEAELLFTEYKWIGNTRELRNICERLIILNETNSIGETELTQINFPSLYESANIKEADIFEQLAQPRISKAEIARMLGVSRTTLWRKIKENSTL